MPHSIRTARQVGRDSDARFVLKTRMNTNGMKNWCSFVFMCIYDENLRVFRVYESVFPRKTRVELSSDHVPNRWGFVSEFATVDDGTAW